MGGASITIISYSIDIDNIKGFVDGIKNACGVEMMGSNEEGKIRFTVSFKPYDDLFIGNPTPTDDNDEEE